MIAAHSGGGAATMASLRALLERGSANTLVRDGRPEITIYGYEAVIDKRTADDFVDRYRKHGVTLRIRNTIAGDTGSPLWRDLIVPEMHAAGGWPLVTHTLPSDAVPLGKYDDLHTVGFGHILQNAAPLRETLAPPMKPPPLY